MKGNFLSEAIPSKSMSNVVERLRISPKELLFKGFGQLISLNNLKCGGVRGGVVVKALRYKPAGREFDSR